MNTDAIIKQLEKALSKKDDTELRLRVEVLVDILKENRPQPIQPIQPVQPAQPIQPVTIEPKTSTTPRVNGAGAIVGGEQLTYKRPKGT